MAAVKRAASRIYDTVQRALELANAVIRHESPARPAVLDGRVTLRSYEYGGCSSVG